MSQLPEAPVRPMTEAAKPLKSTLNLPETAFPMKANLPQNEPARLESWVKQDLYGRFARRGTVRRSSSCTTVRRMPTVRFTWAMR
jgi:hypothetical protein